MTDRTINRFFQRRIVLNQLHRTDRMAQFQDIARAQGIDYRVFFSIPHPNPHASFNLSTYAIIAEFANSGDKTLLLMEDDVVFHEDTDKHLANSIKELPPDWELFYLGANIIGRSAIPYSEHLVKTNAAWTTHAVGISRAGARQILEAGFTIDSGMLDDQLAKRIHGRGRTFIAKPMLAVQRPGYSDLWGRKTDYADIWRINLDKISKA